MDHAQQLDLANLLGAHWQAIVYGYYGGFPRVVDTKLAESVEALRKIGAVDYDLKLHADFLAVVRDVANGRDLGVLQADDFVHIAARYADWYRDA
ncbi:hypothetical protein EVC45_41365 [Paraburkholderia sp. UYCP14C]|uniref:hypothetical protein n=1 Tax=Paraburkholderia sp. UYCP14C TaxID=2511130 RepID=UPI00102098F4|nr:hypothetical protein [Paraburkholderia sp. UYCP14C]RZF23975.1 hypothetical protein EVC45_41365 [Paraburkholderia sp. UYCP14C]